MNITFFNAVSGLMAFQEDMNALSHNMANVNTTGYKSTRTTFEDLLYTEMDVNMAPTRPLAGHGTKISSLDLILEQGIPRQTQSPLDFAIIGEGFFAVERQEQVEYTRQGSFKIGLSGRNRGYLTTQDGAYVLDARGRRIQLSMDENSNTFDTSALTDSLGIYVFSNPYALERTDNASFQATNLSGTAKALRVGRDEMPQVVQSAVESSNVSLPDLMTNMITTQRAYQMSAKLVTTGDQLEEIINNLR